MDAFRKCRTESTVIFIVVNSAKLLHIFLQIKGFEFVKGVHLDPQPFDVERDLSTPTYKLKRPQLLKYYQVLHLDFPS